MNEQQLAAVKQALDALEIVRPMENPEPAVEEAIDALQSIISQDALYKMAEDAVTVGLSYNDWPKIGCVNHDCDQCKAVQEPVAVVSGYYGGQCVVLPTNPARLFNSGTAFYTAPQPVPVKTYSGGKAWPVAPKPWVGLTDEEIDAIWREHLHRDSRARAIEAKLKEKNA
jgi:hypothetical protein